MQQQGRWGPTMGSYHDLQGDKQSAPVTQQQGVPEQAQQQDTTE